jgi:hypothetical protein
MDDIKNLHHAIAMLEADERPAATRRVLAQMADLIERLNARVTDLQSRLDAGKSND